MALRISRRSALLGLAATAAQPLAFGRRRAEDKPVGWAVLGLGYYACYEIMPAFAHCKNSKLVALISGHPDKLSTWGKTYGVPESHRYTYDTMDAIKDNPDIEVVYVITPPALHPKYAIRAAELGKHVCSEKPMAADVEGCEAMIKACHKAHRLLQVGYRCHYEAHNLRAIQACRSGELGTISSFRSDHGFSIGPGQWRLQKALAGGGSMMDIGIYSLNALRYLSGEEPTEVVATITNPPNDHRFDEVEDTVEFKLTLPSGRSASGAGGYSWKPGKNQYEVVGSKGTLRADPATSYEGDRLTLDGKELPVEANNQWAAQMDDMSKCVRRGGRVAAPGEEGLRDIKIIQAIYKSAQTGVPVKLV